MSDDTIRIDDLIDDIHIDVVRCRLIVKIIRENACLTVTGNHSLITVKKNYGKLIVNSSYCKFLVGGGCIDISGISNRVLNKSKRRIKRDSSEEKPYFEYIDPIDDKTIYDTQVRY